MRRFGPFLILALCSLAVGGLTGCEGTDELTQPDPDQILTDVSAGASAVALAGPSSDASVDLIAALMAELEDPVAPATQDKAAATLVHPNCPLEFELDAGISGTCSVSLAGVVTWIFGGTLQAEIGLVSVDGTLIATPTQDQPQAGLRYTIDYDATASSEVGSATWSAVGTVTLDAEHQVVDFTYHLTHTVTPVGGPSAVVEVLVTPTRYELIVIGPMGGVVRFLFDRESMNGVVSVNGFEVAEVTIVEGCAHIDFINENLDPTVVCPEQAAPPVR
jgi:hypothetical protein